MIQDLIGKKRFPEQDYFNLDIELRYTKKSKFFDILVLK